MMNFSLKALVILLALLSSPSATNGQGCSELQNSDLGNTTAASTVGLLADTLMSVNGLVANPSVQILESNTVCLSQGPLKDTYTYTSVVVRYTADANETTSQVEFMCSSGEWVTGTAIETTPDANLTTPVRTDCVLCFSPTIAASTAVEHCIACTDDCDGLMRCNGPFPQTCCSYFDMAESCVTACPANSSPDEDFSCVCDVGYLTSATGSSCEEINECDSDPCENGGTCIDMVNAYSCACAPGYTDANCATDINECDSDPCENGGICTDMVNAYSCACAPGYTDENCTTDINECDPDPCENGGTCTDLENEYSCACVPGYIDDTCSSINECDPDPCENGGTCTDMVNAYSCACVPGYTDANCTTNINECDPDPCENGGTCTDLENEYFCACVPGYTGDNCNVNACDPAPCENNGGTGAHVSFGIVIFMILYYGHMYLL